jgi:cysteine desulfurase
MSPTPAVYLDYNASAPLCPEAAAAMAPWLQPAASNPSSVHRVGQRARAAVERARAAVAGLLGCQPASVVFTSGGTEADNAALWGALGWPPGGHLLISAVEHPAVVEPASALGDLGVELTAVPVDAEARVDPAAVRGALRDDTRLVSVMAANNEVGTLQDIEAIAALAHQAGALFHTDAVQAAPWIDLRPLTAACDLLSISSHKLGGPLGMGALYVRPGLDLVPFIRGGGQQGGRRGGTEATAPMVGFAAACERAVEQREAAAARVCGLRDRMEEALVSAIDGVRRNGAGAARLPNTCHLAFARCDGNALVARLDLDGIAASAGAACAGGVAHGSAVLDAMSVPREYQAGALRLSLGYETSGDDVERAISIVPEAVAALREAGVAAVR